MMPVIWATLRTGPSGEPVARELLLKGDFSNGVHLMQDASEQHAVDKHNHAVIQHWLERDRWNGILLGNIDLFGVGLLHILLSYKLPVLHHVGFVHSPYALTNNQKLRTTTAGC